MKNIFLYGAFASAMVMFSACSNEDAPVVNGGEISAATQEFVLQVSNTGNGLTRAGRPLLSQEGLQTIENVKLILCDGNKDVVYENTITNWMGQNGVSQAYNNSGNYCGQEYSYQLKGDDKLDLEEGTYTLYAIGYHNSSDYDLDELKAIKDGKFDENYKVSLKSEGAAEELFAGEAKVMVNENGGFKADVILNRQVAGAYGYFEKVPYFAGATKLQLVAKSTTLNKGLILGQFMNKDLGNADAEGNTIVATDYAVNGVDAENGNVIYTIDLKTWYGELKEATDEEGNGLGVFSAEKWNKPAEGFFKKGSVFAGEFVIPFGKVNGKETLELQLVGDNGTIYEAWSVSLPTDDKQTKGYPFWSFDAANGWSVATGFTDNASCYNILRNHLYGIGKRLYDNPDPEDPTDPSNPDPDPDPDPDDDKPEALNKKQKLTLRVNSNWEVIHNMVID